MSGKVLWQNDILIVIKHRENIKRLYAGQENEFSLRKKPSAEKSGKTMAARIVLPEGSQEPTDIEKRGGLFHNPLATWTDNPPMQVYDLQGRRLANPPAKGVYIRDGKKVVR